MNFDLQPTLEDDILIIRPLKKEDFQDIYKLASDPLIWEQHQNKDRYTRKKFTQFFNDSLASKGALVISYIETGEIIGSSRFKIIDDTDRVIEIGWSFLSREYWGGQINKRFKKLMINHALKYFNYVVFYVNTKNFRSQRAMEKLGARKTNDKSKPWILSKNLGITYLIDQPI